MQIPRGTPWDFMFRKGYPLGILCSAVLVMRCIGFAMVGNCSSFSESVYEIICR